MSTQPECRLCGAYVYSGPVLCEKCANASLDRLAEERDMQNLDAVSAYRDLAKALGRIDRMQTAIRFALEHLDTQGPGWRSHVEQSIAALASAVEPETVKSGRPDACQAPTAEQMAYRLVNEAIEHGMIRVECSHDEAHACVCTWTEQFIEHAAALFDEYAKIEAGGAKTLNASDIRAALDRVMRFALPITHQDVEDFTFARHVQNGNPGPHGIAVQGLLAGLSEFMRDGGTSRALAERLGIEYADFLELGGLAVANALAEAKR